MEVSEQEYLIILEMGTLGESPHTLAAIHQTLAI
jgi:hypothetical protein